MTKKYIITDDKVLTSIEPTSNYPVSSSAIHTALDGKVDKNGTKQLSTEDFTTDFKTKLEGIADGAEVNVQADWEVTDAQSDAFIAHKPFQRLGAGLSVKDGVLSADTQLHFEVVSALPETGDAQTIYLVENSGEGQNVYDEYAWVNKGTAETPQWSFEKLGSTEFALKIEQTPAGIQINSTPLQSASDTRTGLLTAEDSAAFRAKQEKLEGTAGTVAIYSETSGVLGERAIDDTVTASSSKLITSGAVASGLAGKVDRAEGTVRIGQDATGYYFSE